MSAVINRAKLRYLNAVKWEISVILVCFIGLNIFQQEINLSFLVGSLSSFLPHCVFVYWVFFKSTKYQQKMTAFYRGEAMKWLIAITLIILSFLLIPQINILAFFAGYFLALLLNIVLPIMLNRHTT